MKHYRPFCSSEQTHINAKPTDASQFRIAVGNFRRRSLRAFIAITLSIVGGYGGAARAQSSSGSVQDLLRQAEAAYQIGHYPEAAALFTKAADQGDATAQFEIGTMYMSGKGVEKNCATGVASLLKAADQNFSPAHGALGAMYRDGICVGRDDPTAVTWLLKAANTDDAAAQFLLAQMYAAGRGVAPDDKMAMAWFLKAANHQIATTEFHAQALKPVVTSAQTSVGVMYLAGKGVNPDYGQALNWLQKAANGGNPDAQYWIGTIYEFGLGLAKDVAEARVRYQKAAELGSDLAKTKLAELKDGSGNNAGTINLVCDDVTGGGQPVKSFVFIDPASKYVKFQEPKNTMEFRDGVFGKIVTRGMAYWMTYQAPGQQFVNIGNDVITFGVRAKSGNLVIKIDRRLGLWSVNGGAPGQCSVLPSKRQF